jgi:predicted KAP-like P-loop ATPase
MESGIQNDEPAVEDLLDRRKFAHALSRVIASCHTPLVIGLYGTWGIGKTSLMHQIEADLADARTSAGITFKPVWFDAWRHQFDEYPAVTLLHTMVDALGMESEGRRLLTVIGAALGSVLLKSTTTLGLDDIRKIGDQYEEERFQLREKQVRLQSYFAELISRATNLGRSRLVFFIDDLDRCLPETVLKVLEALKLYLNLPDCVYVIGVDRAALECSIRYRYKDLEVREADYIDKIVQLPFSKQRSISAL